MARNNKLPEPLISVLVCNYNYVDYIAECLGSIFAQTYDNIELVVVDDCSTDESVDKIEHLIKDSKYKVTLIKNQTNKGVCVSRNLAIEAAKGEFFIFVDSDDTLEPDYIKEMLRVSRKTGADVVYSDVKAFGGADYKTDYPEFSLDELLLHNFIAISCLVRVSSIGSHRFDTTLNRKTLEDYDFWLGLGLKGLKFSKAQDTLLNYRIQQHSRNDNTKTIKERVFIFIDIWQYSIKKYKHLYPAQIPEDIEMRQLMYQLGDFSKELTRINLVIHEELLPELKKRESHIASQAEHIRALEKHIEVLDKRLSKGLFSTLASRIVKRHTD